MPFFVNEKKTGTENLYDLVAATNPKAAFYSFSLTTPNIFMTYVGDVIDITIL